MYRLLESAIRAERRLATDINAAVELYGLRLLAPEELLDGLLRRGQLSRELAQQVNILRLYSSSILRLAIHRNSPVWSGVGYCRVGSTFRFGR